MNEIQDKLENIFEIIGAGSAALDENSKPEISIQLNESIQTIIQNAEIDLLNMIADIFNKSFESRMHFVIGEFLDKDIYFNLGEFILDKCGNEEIIHAYLDIFRMSSFLLKIYNERRWDELIYSLIIKSGFSFQNVVERRVKYFQNKPLFRIIHGQTETVHNWNEINGRINQLKKSIFNLSEGQFDKKIAFLMENSLSMALLDIACLTSGIVNVMIPANSVPDHIAFILNQSKAQFIFVSSEKQLVKLKSVKHDLKYLQKAILLEGSSVEEWVLNFTSFRNLSQSDNEFKEPKINPEELATIMYTSGTTGEPKGIMFSHANIIYKRFCRAMAIPGIGENDRFICYLPLYHTFGRYLEMTGSLFWNAEYVFMENPSVATMISNMKLAKPSIFISIPKKWLQLYEYIASIVDIEMDEESLIQEKVNEVTGGNLKYGLSAAGFLPPEVFRFFQKYGVELMSGFGMTEATGGITMTPLGKYVDNSLGNALPGIQIKLAEDGELLIKGNYVMTGYFGQEYDQTFIEGWLPTGDIMQEDSNGYIEIIDRKKEIYKNIKGETVAPQKIENLFKDFETVKQVFLVGDHRQFNTVLIYPDFEHQIVQNFNRAEYENLYSSIIVTVNRFLAPFERIVNFKVIDRPFDEQHGELTPKGTYKRRVIEKNFKDVIEEMYKKDFIKVSNGEIELLIPNWFLRESGCLSNDLSFEENQLVIKKIGKTITIEFYENDLFRIGSYIYKITKPIIDFSPFITSPVYWLGNEQLIDFTGTSIYQWYRKSKKNENISFYKRVDRISANADEIKSMKLIIDAGECSLQGLHLAILHLQSANEDEEELGVKYLEMILKEESLFVYHVVLELLKRPRLATNKIYRRDILAFAVKKYSGAELQIILETYLEFNYDILDDALIRNIADLRDGKDNLEVIIALIDNNLSKLDTNSILDHTPIPSLTKLLVQVGIQHPTLFKMIRQILMKHYLTNKNTQLQLLIRASLKFLLQGFREWIGPNQYVTVDPETGKEYKWKDVIILEEGIDENDVSLIKHAIEESSLIRESIFLFSKGSLIRLNDILPGGLWISLIESNFKKAVYRISIQTRHQGSFDLTLNIKKSLSDQEVEDEKNWLIAASAGSDEIKLIEDFGTYCERFNIWSEEFVAGETLDKFIHRVMRKKDELTEERLKNQWPFFVWNAAASYYSFYKLTGYELELEDCGLSNIVVPLHDYQTGSRIVSISDRIESKTIFTFFERFYKNFILNTVNEFPILEKKSILNYIFSGIYEAEGEGNGLDVLTTLLNLLKSSHEFPENVKQLLVSRLEMFIISVIEREFIPKPLFFAIKRYHRWRKLNTVAASSARAQMLMELYDTYNLSKLDKTHPETRVRFFLETVFLNSNEEIKGHLNDIVIKLHNGELTKEQSLIEYGNLNDTLELNENDSYFITRLCYPHLKPTDSAEFIKSRLDDADSANLVVQLDDYDGIPFLIRKPVSPREIAKLYRLFIEANLQVNFKPENHFFVAISERGFIIGGLFYVQHDNETIHMEKIVVSNRYRRKGISEGLMKEFFNRMHDENYKFITTGFFRPEYFYKFGFTVEPKYSGLVKALE